MSSDNEEKRLIRIAFEYSNVRIYFDTPLTEFEREKVRLQVDKALELDEESQKPKPAPVERVPVRKKKKRRVELEDLVPEIRREEVSSMDDGGMNRKNERRAMISIKPTKHPEDEPDLGGDLLEKARDTVAKASEKAPPKLKRKKVKKKRKRKSGLSLLIDID